MFNMNQGGPFGGGFGRGRGQRQMFNPFGQSQPGFVNPALQGAISFPEKVMGLTSLAVGAAVGGVVLGYLGLSTQANSSWILWFILELALVFATQALADRPGIGLALFIAFGVTTGLMLSPILQLLQTAGEQGIVYEALAATAVTTGGVTLYARATSRDFSRMGGWLFAALIGVVVAMVIGLFVQSTGFQILISAAACVLFTLFLLYDVQRVTHTQMGTQGNAIRAALRIYLDIFNLFINLLMILSIVGGGGGGSRR
jgi:modulator of FtsH protease